jgi:BirA family transcriptional regulator, biotin operon repressor / biotin---[acetyl-CoA-carboxylase] ligase
MINWQAEALWEQLVALAPGLSVEVVPELASTNTTLLERARLGDISPCLLVAERQTAGRGRLGRAWAATPGRTLTFSLAWPADWADWSGLSLAVGLIVAEALDSSGTQLGIKWPNDLWLRNEDRKLGGILIETLPVPGGNQRLAVIGIGLNVMPREADDTTPLATGYACVQEWQPQATVVSVLHQVAVPLVQALQHFGQSGFAPYQSAFDDRDVLQGRRVHAGELEGIVLGVDRHGELLVQTTSCISAISSGEVSIRPC